MTHEELVLELRSGSPTKAASLEAADLLLALRDAIDLLVAQKIAAKAEAPTLPPLTPARKRVLDAYLDLQDRTGWAPTLREVAAELGLSTTTVFDALRRLRHDGHLPQGRGYRGTKAP